MSACYSPSSGCAPRQKSGPVEGSESPPRAATTLSTASPSSGGVPSMRYVYIRTLPASSRRAPRAKSRHRRLGRLEVDDELEPARPLDRQIAGLGALHDLGGVSNRRAPEHRRNVRTVASARHSGRAAEEADHRYPTFQREAGDLGTLAQVFADPHLVHISTVVHSSQIAHRGAASQVRLMKTTICQSIAPHHNKNP